MGYFLMVFLMAFLLLDYAVIYSDATKSNLNLLSSHLIVRFYNSY